MNLGGIIAGGMQGGAAAAQGMAQEGIAADSRTALMKATQDADLARAKALDDYKRQGKNTDRAARAKRVNDAAGMIDREMQERVADKHKPMNGMGPILPAEEVRLSQTQKARNRFAGAAKTGDLAPQTEASLLASEDRLISAERRAEKAEDRRDGRLDKAEAGKNQRQDDALDSREEISQKRLDAALANGGGAGGAEKERLETLMNTLQTRMSKLQESDRGRTPEAKAQWQRDYDDASDLYRAALQRRKSKFDNAAAPSGGAQVNATPKPPGKVGASASTSKEAVKAAADAARAKFFGTGS